MAKNDLDLTTLRGLDIASAQAKLAVATALAAADDVAARAALEVVRVLPGAMVVAAGDPSPDRDLDIKTYVLPQAAPATALLFDRALYLVTHAKVRNRASLAARVLSCRTYGSSFVLHGVWPNPDTATANALVGDVAKRAYDDSFVNCEAQPSTEAAVRQAIEADDALLAQLNVHMVAVGALDTWAFRHHEFTKHGACVVGANSIVGYFRWVMEIFNRPRFAAARTAFTDAIGANLPAIAPARAQAWATLLAEVNALKAREVAAKALRDSTAAAATAGLAAFKQRAADALQAATDGRDALLQEQAMLNGKGRSSAFMTKPGGILVEAQARVTRAQ
ncbi:MAG: ribonuclease T2 family protein, partial [Phycisphaerales bacterium]